MRNIAKRVGSANQKCAKMVYYIDKYTVSMTKTGPEAIGTQSLAHPGYVRLQVFCQLRQLLCQVRTLLLYVEDTTLLHLK